MEFRMRWKWTEKWTFLKNRTLPSLLQKWSFSLSFSSLHFRLFQTLFWHLLFTVPPWLLSTTSPPSLPPPLVVHRVDKSVMWHWHHRHHSYGPSQTCKNLNGCKPLARFGCNVSPNDVWALGMLVFFLLFSSFYMLTGDLYLGYGNDNVDKRGLKRQRGMVAHPSQPPLFQIQTGCEGSRLCWEEQGGPGGAPVPPGDLSKGHSSGKHQ